MSLRQATRTETDASLIEFMKELRDIVGERPITDEELKTSKDALIQGLPRRFCEGQLSKDELLNGLNNILNHFLYGLMCSRLVPPEGWQQAESGATLFKGPDADVKIELGPLSRRVTNPETRDRFIRNFENTLLRALLRESHELILLHCEETNQFPVYKAEPWFQFVRILRNIVSHKEGGVLRQWPNDLRKNGIKQVTWRNRTLDETMIGDAISFYPNEALQLLKDQIDFVDSKLT